MLRIASKVPEPSKAKGTGNYWGAVQTRDRRADGLFVYAVRSTGIYCRPSCPSRKPQREQVMFFQLPEAAEQRGFRPCRRCRPRSARLRDPRIEAVARVCREIDRRVLADGDGALADERLNLGSLGVTAAMGPHQLERAFRSAMGITPRQYADTQRMRRLKSRLRKGDNVTTALYEAGYGSSSRLYERAPGHLGMTPAAYGRGGEGMEIHYAIVNSPLGRLLAGATTRGVSAVYLGQSDQVLESELRREYPRATLVADKARRSNSGEAAGLRQWVERIVEHLQGKEPSLDLPTDVQATAFQRRVWEELRRIPYGTTRTYSQVARAIGQPTAVRAVARACATNPTSIVVPCHRVIREDGNEAGYRWGIGRKRALLDHEAAASRSER